MPCRLLREGILTSERVNRLDSEAELFYRRLLSVVDDHGRFHARSALLRAALYPLKLDTVRDADVERLLAAVAQAGLVRLYQASGSRYLVVLRFRQQVRSKNSKYPAPPQETAQPAEQMPSSCSASAHLDVGEGEGEDGVECEGGGEPEPPAPKAGPQGPAQKPPAAPRPQPEQALQHQPAPAAGSAAAPPAAVQMAIRLREQGVNITSTHPALQGWSARGLSLAQALEAVAIARQRKPHGRIAANYLAAIVEDILAPPPGRASQGGASAWWLSESGILARGREIGVAARPGESMAEYRARLSAASGRSAPRGGP